MSEAQDIFLRAHTVVLPKTPSDGAELSRKKRRAFRGMKKSGKWANDVLVFDCESRIDTGQQLTFGFYRTLKLVGDRYELLEEGAFYDDALPEAERQILEAYTHTTDTEVRTFPPRFPLHSRSEFVKEVLYKMARRGAMIVGFNLCFDLTRLARKWPEGKKNEWSLVLVEYPDGNESLLYPRVLIEPIDSKKSFISFRKEWIPEKGKVSPTKIGDARFLDLRTLLWALFNLPLSLKLACELDAFARCDLPKKIDHKPTGKVTPKEITYARQDVRCTAALLNAAKKEFDLHPISLSPDQAYSPASIAKSYLDAMNIKQPEQKFDVPFKVLGIAMESYMGGRSETRVRLEELPVVPVDFTSEYPTTCALLNLWEVITAERLSFEDATTEVRDLLRRTTLGSCFKPEQWNQFRFFALVKPDDDILPVRTMYNGKTMNIGNNYLTSTTSIWVAGPDLIASAIQTGKSPHVVKAIRVVPEGKQRGMKAVNLRGMVEIDPYKDDLFRRAIEQRKLHKSNPELYYWLKIFANAIYGFFVEINPEPTPKRKPVTVRVYAGEKSYRPEKRFHVRENQGHWYAPYLASLITAGGRLLLAMLERSVCNAGGIHAWADTDALAIVSSRKGGSLRHIPGCENVRALPWKTVQSIIDRFESLNPYDRKAVPGSILNLVDANHVDCDPLQTRRQLLGFSISAKRYTLYERSGEKITIVEPKAHGLGYLYPPMNSPKGWDDEHDAPKWIYEFWECLLRILLKLERNDPFWLKRPQMMRMTVTTQNVLKNLRGWHGFRPYSFFLLPILADSGYPAGIDPQRFRLVAPFESDQGKWSRLECINIGNLDDQEKYRLTTSFRTPEFGKRAVLSTFNDLLYRYLRHPEAKSLAPDGGPCKPETRGLLQRAHIVAGRHRRIGKESDRKWEEGDAVESLVCGPIEYESPASPRVLADHALASERLIQKVKKVGIRQLVRLGFGRRILEKMCRGDQVRCSTLREYEEFILEFDL